MSQAPEWVRAAWVIGAHGVHGELSLEMLGGAPDRLQPGTAVRAGRCAFRVGSVRGSGRVICSLEGLEDREEAAALAGTYLEISAGELRPLPPGEYFHFQLVGLPVQLPDGRSVGEVVDVESYPANDVWVVRGHGGVARVPAVRSAVVEVDLDAGRVVVAPEFVEGWVDAR